MTAVINPPAPQPEGGASADRLRVFVANNAGPLIAVIAAVCWLAGFHPIDPTTLGSFGILPELSPVLLVAYPLLVAGFIVELRDRQRGWALTMITVLAVLAVYALQPAAEPVGRLPVAWLHVGFSDYINAHGAVLHNFDARFSWPGFFAFLALLTGASGLKDSSVLISFAPVVLTGTATVAVRAIALSVFGQGRIAWLAAWVFLIGNWTEQDYLSPQGSTYLLLLAGLAVIFRYLTRPGLLEPVAKGQFLRPAVPANTPMERLFAEVLVVVLALALAPSHQLSPYMLAGLLFVLLLCGRLWARWLPFVALLLAVVWFVLGARDFWIGQLHEITGSIGNLGSSVNQGFDQRLSTNAGRTAMLDVRIGITLIVGLLAAIGAYLLRRKKKRSLTLVLMAITAFAMAVAQPYGGEILIRCYLFALPWFALLAAVLLDDLLMAKFVKPWPRRGALALGAVLIAGLMLGDVAARGGNDAYVAFTRADIDAVQQAYDIAKDGQTLDTVAAYAPVSEWQRLDAVKQASIESGCEPFPNPDPCVRKVHPDFLVLNAAQDAYGQIYYGMKPGWISALGDRLVDSGLYTRIFVQGQSELLELSTDVRK
ncbi:MAG TPA: hypothetical protein VJ914_29700 [Pseudonocardiaceae bacterium]|nr:hypothetical protein [Pseudonocardiaceae bacterium]